MKSPLESVVGSEVSSRRIVEKLSGFLGWSRVGQS